MRDRDGRDLSGWATAHAHRQVPAALAIALHQWLSSPREGLAESTRQRLLTAAPSEAALIHLLSTAGAALPFPPMEGPRSPVYGSDAITLLVGKQRAEVGQRAREVSRYLPLSRVSAQSNNVAGSKLAAMGIVVKLVGDKPSPPASPWATHRTVAHFGMSGLRIFNDPQQKAVYGQAGVFLCFPTTERFPTELAHVGPGMDIYNFLDLLPLTNNAYRLTSGDVFQPLGPHDMENVDALWDGIFNDAEVSRDLNKRRVVWVETDHHDRGAAIHQLHEGTLLNFYRYAAPILTSMAGGPLLGITIAFTAARGDTRAILARAFVNYLQDLLAHGLDAAGWAYVPEGLEGPAVATWAARVFQHSGGDATREPLSVSLLSGEFSDSDGFVPDLSTPLTEVPDTQVEEPPEPTSDVTLAARAAEIRDAIKLPAVQAIYKLPERLKGELNSYEVMLDVASDTTRPDAARARARSRATEALDNAFKFLADELPGGLPVRTPVTAPVGLDAALRASRVAQLKAAARNNDEVRTAYQEYLSAMTTVNDSKARPTSRQHAEIRASAAINQGMMALHLLGQGVAATLERLFGKATPPWRSGVDGDTAFWACDAAGYVFTPIPGSTLGQLVGNTPAGSDVLMERMEAAQAIAFVEQSWLSGDDAASSAADPVPQDGSSANLIYAVMVADVPLSKLATVKRFLSGLDSEMRQKNTTFTVSCTREGLTKLHAFLVKLDGGPTRVEYLDVQGRRTVWSAGVGWRVTGLPERQVKAALAAYVIPSPSVDEIEKRARAHAAASTQFGNLRTVLNAVPTEDALARLFPQFGKAEQHRPTVNVLESPTFVAATMGLSKDERPTVIWDELAALHDVKPTQRPANAAKMVAEAIYELPDDAPAPVPRKGMTHAEIVAYFGEAGLRDAFVRLFWHKHLYRAAVFALQNGQQQSPIYMFMHNTGRFVLGVRSGWEGWAEALAYVMGLDELPGTREEQATLAEGLFGLESARTVAAREEAERQAKIKARGAVEEQRRLSPPGAAWADLPVEWRMYAEQFGSQLKAVHLSSLFKRSPWRFGGATHPQVFAGNQPTQMEAVVAASRSGGLGIDEWDEGPVKRYGALMDGKKIATDIGKGSADFVRWIIDHPSGLPVAQPDGVEQSTEKSNTSNAPDAPRKRVFSSEFEEYLVEGVGLDISPVKARKSLTELVRDDGKVQVVHEWIERLVAEGRKLQSRQVNKVADMTRLQALKADYAEARAHAARQRMAGTKTVWELFDGTNFVTLRNIYEADYAGYLIRRRGSPTDPDGHDEEEGTPEEVNDASELFGGSGGGASSVSTSSAASAASMAADEGTLLDTYTDFDDVSIPKGQFAPITAPEPIRAAVSPEEHAEITALIQRAQSGDMSVIGRKGYARTQGELTDMRSFVRKMNRRLAGEEATSLKQALTWLRRRVVAPATDASLPPETLALVFSRYLPQWEMREDPLVLKSWPEGSKDTRTVESHVKGHMEHVGWLALGQYLRDAYADGPPNPRSPAHLKFTWVTGSLPDSVGGLTPLELVKLFVRPRPDSKQVPEDAADVLYVDTWSADPFNEPRPVTERDWSRGKNTEVPGFSFGTSISAAYVPFRSWTFTAPDGRTATLTAPVYKAEEGETEVQYPVTKANWQRLYDIGFGEAVAAAVPNVEVDVSALPDSKHTNNTAVCPVCFGYWARVGTALNMAQHRYRRPGWGYNVTPCLGSRFPQWQDSSAGTQHAYEEYLAAARSWLDRVRDLQDDPNRHTFRLIVTVLVAGEPVRETDPALVKLYGPSKVDVRRVGHGHPRWQRLYDMALENARESADSYTDSAAFYLHCVRAWPTLHPAVPRDYRAPADVLQEVQRTLGLSAQEPEWYVDGSGASGPTSMVGTSPVGNKPQRRAQLLRYANGTWSISTKDVQLDTTRRPTLEAAQAAVTPWLLGTGAWPVGLAKSTVGVETEYPWVREERLHGLIAGVDAAINARVVATGTGWDVGETREAFHARRPDLLATATAAQDCIDANRQAYLDAKEAGDGPESELSAPVRAALANLDAAEIKEWRNSMLVDYGTTSPTDADWRRRFREAGLGAQQFGAKHEWRGDLPVAVKTPETLKMNLSWDRAVGSHWSGLDGRLTVAEVRLGVGGWFWTGTVKAKGVWTTPAGPFNTDTEAIAAADANFPPGWRSRFEPEPESTEIRWNVERLGPNGPDWLMAGGVNGRFVSLRRMGDGRWSIDDDGATTNRAGVVRSTSLEDAKQAAAPWLLGTGEWPANLPRPATTTVIAAEPEAIPDLSLAALEDGQLVDTEKPYRANGVLFDAGKGAGAFPNNSNINYLGFVLWLRPSEFLDLTPRLEQGSDEAQKWQESLARDIRVAPPMLRVEYDPNNAGVFPVFGHEGRHRMAAIRERSDEPIPVQVFDAAKRARFFEDFDFSTAVFEGERLSSGAATGWLLEHPKVWAINQRLHKTASRVATTAATPVTTATPAVAATHPLWRLPPVQALVRYLDHPVDLSTIPASLWPTQDRAGMFTGRVQDLPTLQAVLGVFGHTPSDAMAVQILDAFGLSSRVIPVDFFTEGYHTVLLGVCRELQRDDHITHIRGGAWVQWLPYAVLGLLGASGPVADSLYRTFLVEPGVGKLSWTYGATRAAFHLRRLLMRRLNATQPPSMTPKVVSQLLDDGTPATPCPFRASAQRQMLIGEAADARNPAGRDRVIARVLTDYPALTGRGRVVRSSEGMHWWFNGQNVLSVPMAPDVFNKLVAKLYDAAPGLDYLEQVFPTSTGSTGWAGETLDRLLDSLSLGLGRPDMVDRYPAYLRKLPGATNE